MTTDNLCLDYYSAHAESPWAENAAEPEDCGAMDPPEFVATCLSCPLKKCMNDSALCPLNRVERNKLTKSGRPDKRMIRGNAYMESLEAMCRMILNGGTPSWICRELGITKDTFYRRRAELVKMGWPT